MSINARERRSIRRQAIRAAAASATRIKRDAFLSATATITASMAAPTGQPARPPRIDIVAYNGGELIVDGFDLPVVINLAGAKIPPTLPLNVDHDQSFNCLLGHGHTSLNGNSLSISGTITADNPNAREVVRMATDPVNPFPFQASIKAIIYASAARRIPPGQRVEINGQTFTGPIIEALESTITHCAVLGEGADQTSTVTIAAKAAQAASAQILKGQAIMTFEEWVASLGLDPASLNPALLAILQGEYADQYPPAATATDPNADPATMSADSATVDPNDPNKKMPVPVAAAAKASSATNSPHVLLAARLNADNRTEAENLRRVATIKAKARDFPLIAAKGIEEGWSADKVELEVLKASRATGRTHAAPVAPNMPLVLEAALAQARRIKGHEKQYSDQVNQAAHDQFRGRIGLQQLLLLAAAANGYQVGPGMRIGMGNLRNVLKYAMPDEGGPSVLHASTASSASVAGILSNIANKELLDGYQEEDQTWREVARIKSVNDFKTVTSYRMLDNMQYEELQPDGKIAHGKLTQMSYTRQAKTYAKMFALTRTDIINDDLGAFDDLKARIGRGAAMKLNRLFWTKWLALYSGGTFSTANGNYVSGATSNLANASDNTPNYVGLQLAVTAFDNLRTPTDDGKKLAGGLFGGSPSILLTSQGPNSVAAELLYKNTNLGTAASLAALSNYGGKYRPVKSVFLGDSTIANYSTAWWWLLRDPSVLAAIVVSFLDGVETPTVEQADADFDQLGVQFRGYHDFGIDAAEPLAGVMVAGA